MQSKLLAKRISLPNGTIVYKPRSFSLIYIIVLLLLIYLSARLTGFDVQLLARRILQFFVIIKEMIVPNWQYAPQLVKPLIATIKMSLLGSWLGAIAAMPFAIAAARNIYSRVWLSAAVKFLLSVLRTLPTLIVALIATFVFGLGTTAGTVAIFMFSLAYIAKLLYEHIENADMKAYEAMQAMGLTTLQSFRYAVLPQVLPHYLATSLFCFEGNVRYASILGYVGAGGIGLLLNESLGWRSYSNVGIIILLLAVTVYIIEASSNYIRKKLV